MLHIILDRGHDISLPGRLGQLTFISSQTVWFFWPNFSNQDFIGQNRRCYLWLSGVECV